MNENNVFNVVIADSQFLIVRALQSLIEADERFLVAGVTCNQIDLYELLEKFPDGLLIIDFANIDFDGIDDLKVVREKFPQIAILILTNSISKIEFSALTRLGIRSIIFKTVEKEELFSAIDATLKGRKFYSDEILDLFLDVSENRSVVEDSKHLTVSEMEIVKLIVSGLTTKEIAAGRCISPHTVNTHRKNILRKMEVSNASELIMHAIKAGWIDNIEYNI